MCSSPEGDKLVIKNRLKRIEENKKLEAEKAAAVRAGATRFMVAGEESFGGS